MPGNSYKQSQSAGIEASKIAARVKGWLDNVYDNPLKTTWDDIIASTQTFWQDDMAQAVIEVATRCKMRGLPVRYYPQLWTVLCGIANDQWRRRIIHAKGDISSYAFMMGKKVERGEPVWELSPKYFILYVEPGGSCTVKGEKGFGKSLFGTQNLCKPYCETFRHVVTGVYADSFVSDILDKPFDYYHYHSRMSSQLTEALEIKIKALEKQRNEWKGSGEPIYNHPLLIDLIDEASMSRGKHRTMAETTMQQMYIQGIARHIGIWTAEIHPFDDVVVWVRDHLTHEFEFTERGKLNAIIKTGGHTKEKKVWGFKSLEDLIRDGEPHIRYRPYAPVSFTVDVDVIAMLDVFNARMELKLKSGQKVNEIDEWREIVRWLHEDKAARLDEQFGLTYNQFVTSIALFLVELEEYEDNMRKLGGRPSKSKKPLKITQQLIHSVTMGGPFEVKRGTLAEHVVKARRILQHYDYRKFERMEVEKEVYEKLRQSEIPIDLLDEAWKSHVEAKKDLQE